jgi:hypothetical protein
MPYFTHENTSDYTDQQLAELNERYEHALAVAGPVNDGTRAQQTTTLRLGIVAVTPRTGRYGSRSNGA